MENSVKAAQAAVFKQVGVVQIAALLVGLLYVSGYYINSMFLRNYGIPPTELIKLEYIRIGYVFLLTVFGVSLLPIGAYFLTASVRSASGLPNYWLGLIGNSANVVVFVGVPLGLSLIATDFEWNYRFTDPVLGFSKFSHAVGTAIALSVFLVIFLPWIERSALRSAPKDVGRSGRSIAIEIVRYGGLLASIILVASSVAGLPWASVVLGKALPFLAVAAVFGALLVAAYYWVNHIKRTQGSAVVLVIILVGVAFFYNLAMTSYVYGLYPAIPGNRGGKLPLTKVFLQVEGYDGIIKASKTIDGVTLRGPIFVVEESDKAIYFADSEMNLWFEEFVTVHSIKTDAIKYVRAERISDGFPKIRNREAKLGTATK